MQADAAPEPSSLLPIAIMLGVVAVVVVTLVVLAVVYVVRRSRGRSS